MLVLATAAFGLSVLAYGLVLFPFLLVLFLFGIALGIFAQRASCCGSGRRRSGSSGRSPRCSRRSPACSTRCRRFRRGCSRRASAAAVVRVREHARDRRRPIRVAWRAARGSRPCRPRHRARVLVLHPHLPPRGAHRTDGALQRRERELRSIASGSSFGVACSETTRSMCRHVPGWVTAAHHHVHLQAGIGGIPAGHEVAAVRSSRACRRRPSTSSKEVHRGIESRIPRHLAGRRPGGPSSPLRHSPHRGLDNADTARRRHRRRPAPQDESGDRQIRESNRHPPAPPSLLPSGSGATRLTPAVTSACADICLPK